MNLSKPTKILALIAIVLILFANWIFYWVDPTYGGIDMLMGVILCGLVFAAIFIKRQYRIVAYWPCHPQSYSRKHTIKGGYQTQAKAYEDFKSEVTDYILTVKNKYGPGAINYLSFDIEEYTNVQIL